MCKLRQCLATARRWQLAALAAVVLLGGAICVDYWRAGTLVLEWRTEPKIPRPRIQVEIFSDGPTTEHLGVSVFRRLYSAVRELTGLEPEWISAHHDLKKVQSLRRVASEWIEPGETRGFRLKPGRYLVSREIWWRGRDGVPPGHSGFQYRTIEIKAGERIEIDDLLHGWDR
jgi:hypothetical protein